MKTKLQKKELQKKETQKKKRQSLKDFYVLWATQGLSQLGSTMTNFALTLWLYQETGSALHTALLSVCSYAPYVLVSMFAGALSDKWDKKKTMLVCDTLAACCTLTVFALFHTGWLMPWHLYVLNAVNGLMNTVQSPASDVTVTLLAPKEQYQKVSGLRSFSHSLITILHPLLATSLYAAGGMDMVIAVDLATFAVAFVALLCFVQLPVLTPIGSDNGREEKEQESLWRSVKGGLRCLQEHRLVLLLILFLAGVNLVASAFDAVLPAFVLPREQGGEAILGMVTSTAGVAMLAGSILASLLPAPKNRVKVIWLTMLLSLTVDNALMSLTRVPMLWCIAQVFGYLPVPLMNTNLDVIVRSSIPTEMQGRVYSCRNTLQFFTIPVGFLLGGWLVDSVCEPWMELQPEGSLLLRMFGEGKGSGAAMVIFLLGVLGAAVCLVFGRLLHKYQKEQ